MKIKIIFLTMILGGLAAISGNATVVTIQVPHDITYSNSSADVTNLGPDYFFTLQDINNNPMGSVYVQINETFGNIQWVFTNNSNAVLLTQTTPPGTGVAWPINGSGISDILQTGQWWDFVDSNRQSTMSGFASAPGNGGVCYLEAGPYSHSYDSAFYKFSTYTFATLHLQTQNFFVRSDSNGNLSVSGISPQ